MLRAIHSDCQMRETLEILTHCNTCKRCADRWSKLCELSLGFEGSSNSIEEILSCNVEPQVEELSISRFKEEEQSDLSALSQPIARDPSRSRRRVRMSVVTAGIALLAGTPLLIEMLRATGG